LAAIEKFTAPEPEATETDRPEARYTPETLPDFWLMALATKSAEPVALTPIPESDWGKAIAPKPVPVAKPQLFLPAAKEVAPALDAKAEAIAMEYETGPLTILELCEKYQMSAQQMTDLCRVHLGDRYEAVVNRKRQARFQAEPTKPQPTPEPVQPAIATPSPQMQPDGETPDLNDFSRVPSATGWFKVSEHGEGYVVTRWKDAKKKGWEHTTHLIGSHGCDCEQARKKPSSICCHQKAVKSHELAKKNQAIAAEWQRKQAEKSAKFSAEMKAIETQRKQDEEAKLSGLIRSEVKEGKHPQAIKLAKKLDRSALLTECRDLFMACAFDASSGMQLLSDRYQKADSKHLTDEELEDLADYLSANRITLRKKNRQEEQPVTITTGCKVEIVANERDYENLIGKSGTVNFSNGKTHAVFVANVGLRYFTESSLKRA
jgi:hypothetical protein